MPSHSQSPQTAAQRPASEAPPQDFLEKLKKDIPAEQARIRQQAAVLQEKDPARLPAVLAQELTGTVMSIQRDQTHHIKEVRDFALAEVLALRDAVSALDIAFGAHDERLLALEEQQEGNGLTDDEVIKFTMLADGTLAILEQLKQQPGVAREVYAALDQHRQLAEECKRILAAFELEDDEDDEEEQSD